MRRRPPKPTRTETRSPYTTLFRSLRFGIARGPQQRRAALFPQTVEPALDRRIVEQFALHPRDLCLHPGIVLKVERQLREPLFDAQADRVIGLGRHVGQQLAQPVDDAVGRSEEHTSELQSLMRISYAVFCLKKKKTIKT